MIWNMILELFAEMDILDDCFEPLMQMEQRYFLYAFTYNAINVPIEKKGGRQRGR